MSSNNIDRAAIFGGTGLIGRALSEFLITNGYKISIFSRNPEKSTINKSEFLSLYPFDDHIIENLEGHQIIINLTGENISSRWTEKKKKKIIDSRVITTKKIIKAINNMKKKPEVYIQASAIGFYPFSKTEIFNESSIKGDSFLSEVVGRWESASQSLDANVRKVIIRKGVVISKHGGMLPKIILPIRLFTGGIPGKGDNWVSWIHIDDVAASVLFLIKNRFLKGIFNLTGPYPVEIKDLILFCGKILRRPVPFKIPHFIIKILFGKMGVETILSSQKVIPKRLLENNYSFSYSNFKEAIEKELSMIKL